MSHVSIELAKQLKDVGLVFVPQEGDCLALLYNRGCKSEYRKMVYLNEDDIEEYEETNEEVWLPSFSRLIKEIGKLGFRWNIGNLNDSCCAGLFDMDTRQYVHGQFYGDIPEDALGRALLWILLERKAGKVGTPQ